MKKIILILTLFFVFIYNACFSATVTWSPDDKNQYITLSNGNLTSTASATGSFHLVRATHGRSSGKYYFEFYINSGNGNALYGITTSALDKTNMNIFVGVGDGVGYYAGSHLVFNNSASSDVTTACTNGDRIQVAVNLDSHKIWFGKNGTWLLSGNPATDTNPTSTGFAAGTYYPAVSEGPSTSSTVCFTSCYYTPPSGFLPFPAGTISGTLKESESDATGSAIEYLILGRTDGSVFSAGTASAAGIYSVNVSNDATEYDVFMLDPADSYAPKTIGEMITGVTP